MQDLPINDFLHDNMLLKVTFKPVVRQIWALDTNRPWAMA
jgi:hypothetical protein